MRPAISTALITFALVGCGGPKDKPVLGTLAEAQKQKEGPGTVPPSGQQSQIVAKVKPQTPQSIPDVRMITSDFSAAVHLRPRVILESEVLTNAVKPVRRSVDSQLSKYTKAFGIEPADVDSVLAMFAPTGSSGPSTGALAIVVRSHGELNQEQVLSAFQRQNGEELTEKEVSGESLRVTNGMAIAFPRPDQFVIAGEPRIADILAGSDEETALKTELLEAASRGDVAAACDFSSARDGWRDLLAATPFGDAISNVKSASISLNPTGSGAGPLLKLGVTAESAAGADTIHNLLSGLTANRASWPKLLQSTNEWFAGDETKRVFASLSDSLTVAKVERGVNVEIPLPKNYGGTLAGVLNRSATRKRNAYQAIVAFLKRIKKIVLAFHEHHKEHDSFPAAGAEGGLSWRVHILPYIGQSKLHARFRLDEPWDSEHNRQFIKQMPEEFRIPGIDVSGQTTLHVFLGEGAPFGDGTAKPMLGDFRAPSRTVLVMAAGPETLEPWTKPGGLRVNPQQPRQPIGSPPFRDTYWVGMGDAGVYRLSKSLGDQKLRNYLRLDAGL